MALTSTTSASVKTVFQYNDGDERAYVFAGASSAVQNTIVNKIKAINASLTAGTDDGLKDVIVSDGGAVLVSITSATYIQVTETPLEIVS